MIELWKLEDGRFYGVKLENSETYVVGGEGEFDTFNNRVVAYTGPLDDVEGLSQDPSLLRELAYTEASGDDYFFSRELEIVRPEVAVIARLESP